MTNSIWESIADTPWWVYLVFIILIRMGYAATKGRVVHIRSFLVLPVIFIFTSLLNFFVNISFTPTNIALWLGTTLIGIAVGCIQFQLMKIKAVPNENKLYLPGTWGLLILLMLLFAARYYTGYEIALDPTILQQPKWMMGMFLLYGLLTGLFIGRAFCAVRRLKRGPYTV
ncbi:MAG: hypothetical protein EPO11_09310 [Gammaproteobacteria bacterium]|nr:MAG: hypothetical protein EPO11_09310 [Gammaproteobacteria bacterium]